MKFFSYIQYFFYLGLNWNWRIASHIIREEIKGEKKYGIDTTGADELKAMKKAGIDITHATVYMPITYFQLDEIFKFLPKVPRKHFLDIGCGKGRALCIAAYNGYQKVTGIDFSPAFCKAAGENLEIIKVNFQAFAYELVNKDAALAEIPKDVDCIFFFNPFDAVIMKRVVNNIKSSLQLFPREIFIVYANPLYKQLLLEINFKEVYYSKRLNYLELSIMKIPA